MRHLRENIERLSPEERAALARRVLSRRRAAPEPGAIPRRRPDDPCPLSFSQQRLWFLDQLEQGNPAYNVYRAVRITGALDRDALRRGLEEIVRRHDVLRTNFPDRDGLPVQIVAPARAVGLPLFDLGELPADRREALVRRLASAEARRRFDLATEFLLRTKLLRLGEREHVLLLTTHHIVADGWSVGVLFSELATLYEAFATSCPSPLAEPPIQYADFALWQRRGLQGAVLQGKLAYWRARFATLPPRLALPTDRLAATRKSFRGARHFFHFPGQLVEDLSALGRQEGATLFMTLLAGFKALLHRLTGEVDLAVGSPVAGRDWPEVEGLIGCFNNTLVLRTNLAGSPTFRELLRRVRDTALGAFAHRELPFEKVVEEVRPSRVPNQTPLFQVNFRVLTTPQPPPRLAGLELTYLEVDNQQAKFDLAFELCARPDGLRGYVEYFSDLFDASTIARLAEEYAALLGEVAQYPDTPLAAPGQGSARTALRSPPVFTLRQASLKDSEFIYRLRALTLERYVGGRDGWSEERQQAYYLDFDPREHCIIRVGRQDVGAIAFVKKESAYHLLNIHILPEQQGHGLGSAVLRHYLAEADLKGLPTVAEVFKDNPALKLYERLGFRATGVREQRHVITRSPAGEGGGHRGVRRQAVGLVGPKGKDQPTEGRQSTP